MKEEKEIIEDAYDYIGNNDKTGKIIVSGKRQEGAEFLADFVKSLIKKGKYVIIPTSYLKDKISELEKNPLLESTWPIDHDRTIVQVRLNDFKTILSKAILLDKEIK